MNIGYEDDNLEPHIEPVKDYNDPVRIGKSPQQTPTIKSSSNSSLLLFLFFLALAPLPAACKSILYLASLNLLSKSNY